MTHSQLAWTVFLLFWIPTLAIWGFDIWEKRRRNGKYVRAETYIRRKPDDS